MAYVAVKGGEKAIAAAHDLLAQERRGDPDVPEIGVDQIREQLSLAVDRVMAEGSCYDRDLAALALKQARGDVPEAVFLLRAYRTTLPRFGRSAPVDTEAMTVRRRVSAAFKDLPGGQVLGPTFDYTHRLLDFTLAAEGRSADSHGDAPETSPETAAAPLTMPMPTIAQVMAEEDLLEREPRPADDAGEPFDITRDAARYPADRDQRLQALARGDEGFLLSLAYACQRGWGGDHPLCGEVRFGEVGVAFTPPELGFEIEIGEISATECQMIASMAPGADGAPQLSRGYGLAFGHNERKTMSMAILDRALKGGAVKAGSKHATEDDEFVLSHCDNVEASGFVQHLKLPHYVDFQGALQILRTLRAEHAAKRAAREAAE